MIKKALAFILASFIFTSVFFKSMPVKASDYAIPNSGWLPVIYDIFYSLVNGNEINFAELAGDLTGINAIIDRYNELRTAHFESPFESSLNLSFYTYLASIYEGDLYDLAAQYSIYLKDGIYPVLGKYSKDRVARWNQFDTQFNDKYLSLFDTDVFIEPTPDLAYIPYLEYMNDSFIEYLNNPSNITFLINPESYSFINCYVSNGNLINNNSGSFYGDQTNIGAMAFNYFDINIVSDSNTGTYSYSVNYGTPILDIISFNNHTFDYIVINKNSNQVEGFQDVNNYSTYNFDWFNRGTYPSLNNLFIDLRKHYANVNVYVDGVPWALVGNILDPSIVIPPSVIRNDNGLIDSQDVFVPDQDLAFDIIGLINLIDDAIENDDTLTFDDIVNDGNILKNPDGSALDDARSHILQNTIQRVIADEYEKDDPEPIPTTTPPPYPTLPDIDWRKNPIPQPLPTGFDTSNGNPADAFSGASTLAQIVDATNRGLPSELVYTFWGIVFGMIVLGIIKVLHK